MKQKIKYLLIGTVAGTLLSSSVVFAANPIKLIVDGKEIMSETKPIMYQNSVYVPVRTVSEALGVDVRWDSGSNSVVIGSNEITKQQSSTINNELIEKYQKTYLNPIKNAKNIDSYSNIFDNGAIKVKIDKYSNNYNIYVLKDNIYTMFPEYAKEIESELKSMKTYNYQNQLYISTNNLGLFLESKGLKVLMDSCNNEFYILTNEYINKFIMN